MRFNTLILMAAVLFLAGCGDTDSPTTSDQQDMVGATMSAVALSSSEGAKLTKRKCASCHSLDRNIRKVGPSLKGIMGKTPSIADMPFDRWTEENMDRWLENPRAVKKRTRMALPGISDPSERKAIIAYLKRI
jgi:cytochrome c